jgi:hypothetical protein
VLHACDNPPCTRNDDIGVYEVQGRLLLRRGHLFLGTYADNNADKAAKGRSYKPTRWPVLRGDANPMHRHPELALRGDAHGRAKLTSTVVLQARQLVADGDATIIELAERYDVNVSTLRRAVRKQSWSHL